MQEQLAGKYRFRVATGNRLTGSQIVVLQVECQRTSIGCSGDSREYTYWRDAKVEDLLGLGFSGVSEV